LLVAFVAILVFKTVRNQNFWRTPDQRGDALLRAGKFAEAGQVYSDPWHIGVAQYRNGDFESAAKTFARVPGATGAFDQGNAFLMHGNYDGAIASYDRALGFRRNWKEAEENKALAIARKAKLEASGKNREEEQTGPNPEEEPPDEIVFDQKGSNKRGEPVELTGEETSDEALRATWLRNVQTTPADFLRAKFAYQASHESGNGKNDTK
jgi:Ca-activated chloride channel family protein